MRIVGGRFKGCRVELRAASARPTSDKVREALFSILYDRIEDAAFLDLFAGSGCVGIEALSRGAAKVVFGDRDGRAICALGENLVRFGAEPEAYELLVGNFEATCRRLVSRGDRFDLIYLDPPYDAGFYESAMQWGEELLRAHGWLIAEHRSDATLPESFRGLTRLQSRRYGTQCISIYARQEDA